jgi:ABC-type uncharacterized transport system YnjBCD substrate-binding protein
MITKTRCRLLVTGIVAALTTYGSVAAKLDAPAESNLKNADFDISKLNPDNFYQTLVPVAKSEGTVTLYNFAASYPPYWKDVVIPAFAAKYGIKVEFFPVKLDSANQQLIAVQQTGRDAPTDVYFADGQTSPALLRPAGVIANLPLAKLLPEARNYNFSNSALLRDDPSGNIIPFHINQSAIGYNSALLPEKEVPSDFVQLLTFAQSHPGKVAVTSPLKGGSGSGFLMSVTSHFINDQCRKTYSDANITKSEAQNWVYKSGCMDPVWNYLRNLLKASELTNGNADTVNLIANNQVTIGTVIEDNAFNAVKQSRLPDTIRQTLMSSGEVGGADGIFILSGAKHPAAALLFIDFAMTHDMQAWKLSNMASRSLRTDITVENVVKPDDKKFLVTSQAINSYRITWPAPAISTAIISAFEEQVLSKL